MKKALSYLLATLIGASAISQQLSLLEKEFKYPPVSARPKALWPWLNGNFSIPQITHELEEAKKKGMGGFDI